MLPFNGDKRKKVIGEKEPFRKARKWFFFCPIFPLLENCKNIIKF